MHHHMCASENKWLKWISDDKIEGRKCFDCWLLEASLKGTVHALQLHTAHTLGILAPVVSPLRDNGL